MSEKEKISVENGLRETREKINAWRTYHIEQGRDPLSYDEQLASIDAAICFIWRA